LAAVPAKALNLIEELREPSDGIKLVVDNSKPRVCVTGRLYGTHTKHVYFKDGEWQEIPDDFNYRKEGRSGTCPDCEHHYSHLDEHRDSTISTMRVANGSALGYLHATGNVYDTPHR